MKATMNKAIVSEIISVSVHGNVYLGPCEPGTVADAHYDDAFEFEGKAEDVLAAYVKWSRDIPEERLTDPRTKNVYSKRYIRSFRIGPHIAAKIAKSLGLSYGEVIGTLSRLEDDAWA